MGTYLPTLANDIKKSVVWQKTPTALSDEDYMDFIMYGLRHLYVDTGRAASYNDSLFTDDTKTTLVQDLPVDEQEYIKILAKIAFFKRVQTDVNNIVSYVTDALTVTNAHRPYAHLQDSIGELQKERRIVYYKMARYCLL